MAIIAAVLTPDPVTVSGLLFATFVIAAFIAALFVAAIALPGPVCHGAALANGERRAYKMNGMSMWVATHMFVVSGSIFYDLSLTRLCREFWSLFIVANVVAVALTIVLWKRGRDRAQPQGIAPTIKNTIKDMWYGVELNPTWLGVDLKVFAYQPSLIGLSVLNVSFAWAQVELYGTFTPQMFAYQAFWWLYMTSHYHYEAGILSMWDIIAERFGFMLIWGDFVLVPFFYCIAGWWIVAAPAMPWPHVMAIAVVFGLGIWIFRGANAQKDRFKRDPNTRIWGRPAQAVGGRLLVSGWWGLGRKINYTGEIMVYTAFALCTGFQSIVPYLLPIWLCLLLPHRAWRDEKRCRQKYGALWDEYTRRARFRMVPFVY